MHHHNSVSGIANLKKGKNRIPNMVLANGPAEFPSTTEITPQIKTFLFYHDQIKLG